MRRRITLIGALLVVVVGVAATSAAGDGSRLGLRERPRGSSGDIEAFDADHAAILSIRTGTDARVYVTSNGGQDVDADLHEHRSRRVLCGARARPR